jgi:NAD(P)-dependent dehydrogenase (short-subunit alcohol dehydrogenase family)
LDGRVGVVTGASSGIGVGIALAFAAAGADVVIGARRLDRLEETRAAVEALGVRCVAVPTDVRDEQACENLAQAAIDSFGRLDILANNAGIGGDYHPATEDPPEHFRDVLEVNLFGAYWMARAAARRMTSGGSIINLSSVMALTTAKMPATAYASSKAGVLGMTRDLAAQWGERRIRVNAILPGVVHSEATANYSENYQRKIIDLRIPIGRIGEPTDVGRVAVFLASDASAYVTGVSLPVDGGLLLF